MSSTGRHHRVSDANQPARRAPRRLERPAWEREMRRVRMTLRALGVALLALLARGLLKGWTVALGLSALVIGVLLLLALVLQHHGRTLEPGRRPKR